MGMGNRDDRRMYPCMWVNFLSFSPILIPREGMEGRMKERMEGRKERHRTGPFSPIFLFKYPTLSYFTPLHSTLPHPAPFIPTPGKTCATRSYIFSLLFLILIYHTTPCHIIPIIASLPASRTCRISLYQSNKMERNRTERNRRRREI